MASAHGAGLMALPFAMAARGTRGNGAEGAMSGHNDPSAVEHLAHLAPSSGVDLQAGHHVHGNLAMAGLSMPELTSLVATLIHTAGYLLVTGLVAVLVYEKLGLRLLRTAWINLNLIWGAALVVTGVLTAVL
jgi:hypothetical protein